MGADQALRQVAAGRTHARDTASGRDGPYAPPWRGEQRQRRQGESERRSFAVFPSTMIIRCWLSARWSLFRSVVSLNSIDGFFLRHIPSDIAAPPPPSDLM
ncbi:unnamed protein product, partial [Phaeothamnion confervicola]